MNKGFNIELNIKIFFEPLPQCLKRILFVDLDAKNTRLQNEYTVKWLYESESIRR